MTEKNDYITPEEASVIAEVSSATIRTWCDIYGIGIKVGGRWKVFPDRLEKFMQGSYYETEKIKK